MSLPPRTRWSSPENQDASIGCLPEIPKMVETQAEAIQVTAEAQVEAVQAIVETQVEAKVVVKPEVQKPQEINYCF